MRKLECLRYFIATVLQPSTFYFADLWTVGWFKSPAHVEAGMWGQL